MNDMNINVQKSEIILRSQQKAWVGYIVGLFFLSLSILLMPTEVLLWHTAAGIKIYGHGLLFWASLLWMILCFHMFKKQNKFFRKTFATKVPQKRFTLCGNHEAKLLGTLAIIVFFIFTILSLFVRTSLPRFIVFSLFIFLLGLYLGLNSYEYQIYHKHRILTLHESHSRPNLRQGEMRND